MEVGGDFGSQSDALRDNIPPVLEVEGRSKRQRRRWASRSTLVAFAGDPDNLPARPRRSRAAAAGASRDRPPIRLGRRCTVRRQCIVPHQRAWPAAVVDRLSRHGARRSPSIPSR